MSVRFGVRKVAVLLVAGGLAAGCASSASTEDEAAAPASAAEDAAESAAEPGTTASEKVTVAGMPCFNPEGGYCLGALEPGTYRTKSFKPRIRYTTPEGWVNGEDLPGNFLLYREDDPQEGFLGGSFVGIYTDVRAPQPCAEDWADGVGHTPADLAAWYAEHPGLAAIRPRPVEVGGLRGLVIDVPLRSDWDRTCPWSQGRPVVPVIIGSGVSQLHHTAIPGSDTRLIVLSWRDTNVTIEISSVTKQHSKQEYLDLVEPIIESLVFDRS
jgi:hypothetical protein